MKTKNSKSKATKQVHDRKEKSEKKMSKDDKTVGFSANALQTK